MSSTRRQRDSLAPSLFPFLAVLLCTMGALVLILMLVVAGAQASTARASEATRQQIEDTEALLEMAKDSYERQLTEGRIALEKKRLVLQHLETHIQELLDELADLKRTAELLDQDKSPEGLVAADREAELSELEKRLAKATAELDQRLEKPDGDKPIFAIIPYQGSKGTHRRPIYIECTAEGVILQPEGIPLRANDLKPPYGPGNPLDAALRTIRAEFPPSNGAVTSTAYPLLVVRPSGIQAYVHARAAMSGWDDQFGYELVEEDLELAFPETTPGLKNKLVKALELARERQAALVMAMPQKYRGREAAYSDDLGDDWETGDADPRAGDMTAAGSHLSAAGGSPEYAMSGRGGFSLEAPSSLGAGGSEPPGTGGEPGTGGDGPGLGFGSDTAAAEQGLPNAGFAQTGDANPYENLSLDDGSNLDSLSGAELAGNVRRGAGQPQASAADAWGDPSDAPASGTSPGGEAGTNAPNTAGGGTASTQPGQQFQLNAPTGATQSSPQGASAGPTSQPSMQAAGQSGTTASQSDNSQESAGGATAQSFNASLNRAAQQESSRPVAKVRGRNWAWSQGPPTETPVVRSIRLQCLSDRWIVLPDSGSSKQPLTISFESTPRQRAEQLARVVVERVESWGIALTGGHWKPVLLVDVGSDAEWRFEQLQQLLDGSGLEIRRRAAK